MADKTSIEWTDATWNPLRGCSRVSQGCVNCYAETIAARFSDPGAPYHGIAERGRTGSKWTGKVELVEHILDQPLRWQKPRRIFVNSMSDLFHEAVPDEWIDRIFAVMALAPHHVFQVLTKRPERMQNYLANNDLNYRLSAACGNMLDGDWIWSEGKKFRTRIEDMIQAFLGEGSDDSGDIFYIDDPMPLPNVWLGVSVENQQTADERIPLLLETPAAKRFISAEPLLGAIDLNRLYSETKFPEGGLEQRWDSCISGKKFSPWADGEVDGMPRLDWVICGGESGANARPMRLGWARDIRDHCAGAGVPFFFKQWGEWIDAGSDEFQDIANADHRIEALTEYQAPVEGCYRVGKKRAGAMLDGREHKAFPA